jgi:hypothetical protein
MTLDPLQALFNIRPPGQAAVWWVWNYGTYRSDKPYSMEFKRRWGGWAYRRRWPGYSERWKKTSDAGRDYLLARYTGGE